MADLFKKISIAAKSSTTYRVGLLQAKAYRSLKTHTTRALKKYSISTIEWAFLGLLYEHPAGLRAVQAAEELGVEPPFVTALMKKLEKKKFVRSAPSKEDSRAKMLNLTSKGRAFVDTTEQYLRHEMRPLLVGSSMDELLSYVFVLETIIRNTKKEDA